MSTRFESNKKNNPSPMPGILRNLCGGRPRPRRTPSSGCTDLVCASAHDPSAGYWLIEPHEVDDNAGAAGFSDRKNTALFRGRDDRQNTRGLPSANEYFPDASDAWRRHSSTPPAQSLWKTIAGLLAAPFPDSSDCSEALGSVLHRNAAGIGAPSSRGPDAPAEDDPLAGSKAERPSDAAPPADPAWV